ncbi:CAP domain-containing protein [Wielerella bovis]|uniref:CAP domain-containing protein n=1 Tax=Wielerella bovis TaxID=2917790 RepID=UPI0020193E18|nr:CAP domain-containing protein [Wielerella bovis]ULJ61274.1 CAP domain-containing protein [Wielerella bovis]
MMQAKWFLAISLGIVSLSVGAETLSPNQKELFNRINEFRSQARQCGSKIIPARQKLTWNKQLAHAAAQHALDMAKNNYMAYDSPRGVTPWQRIMASNYAGWDARAAIGAGYQNVNDILAQWTSSPSCEYTLMDEHINEIGIAQVRAAGSYYGNYWVMYAGVAAQDYSSEQMLNAVNRIRSQGRMCGARRFQAAPPLRWNKLLQSSAQKHAQDMANQDYYGHVSRDGRTLRQRINQEGYVFVEAAENVAAGQLSLQQVLDNWLDSPLHCENLMDANVSELGMAYAYRDNARFKIYWVQNFAAPRPPKTLPQPTP